MNGRILHTFALASVSAAALLVTAPADAGLFRAYLSQNGNDLNP